MGCCALSALNALNGFGLATVASKSTLKMVVVFLPHTDTVINDLLIFLTFEKMTFSRKNSSPLLFSVWVRTVVSSESYFQL